MTTSPPKSGTDPSCQDAQGSESLPKEFGEERLMLYTSMESKATSVYSSLNSKPGPIS